MPLLHRTAHRLFFVLALNSATGWIIVQPKHNHVDNYVQLLPETHGGCLIKILHVLADYKPRWSLLPLMHNMWL